MKRIKRVPVHSTLVPAAIASFIPFVFLTLFFIFNERALRASSPYGVLEFELAWTPKMVDKVFTAWGPANVEHQIYAHHVDNLYLFVYGLFALLCVLLLARRLEGRLQEAGFFFVLAPVLAAVFDAMENVFLLSMLNRGAPGGWSDPVLASLCATFKIAFLGASIAFIFIAGVWLLARRYGARAQLLPRDRRGRDDRGRVPFALATLPVLRDRPRILLDCGSIHMGLKTEQGCRDN